MNLLNEELKKIKFEDVVDFCSENVKEGFQLDYKREVPKDLSKLTAAFANSRGGLIIIGIEEDKDTGVPIKFEGIERASKEMERVNQMVANVDPLPIYDISMTNEKNNKSFILLRIFEGSIPPYYAANDSTIWVRTGDVRTPIKIASKEYAERLSKKRDKAKEKFDRAIVISKEIYLSQLRAGEKERKEKIKRAEKTLEVTLGTNVSMLKQIIMPIPPDKELMAVEEIKSNIEKFRVTRPDSINDFPPLDLSPIPGGLGRFRWTDLGTIYTQNIFPNGVLLDSRDVLRCEQDGSKKIWIGQLGVYIFCFLKQARNFYKEVSYQGALDGVIQLDNLEDVNAHPIVPSRWSLHIDRKTSLLKVGEWPLRMDTVILNDQEKFMEFYYQILKKISWDFGYGPETFKKDLFDDYLSENGLKY